MAGYRIVTREACAVSSKWRVQWLAVQSNQFRNDVENKAENMRKHGLLILIRRLVPSLSGIGSGHAGKFWVRHAGSFDKWPLISVDYRGHYLLRAYALPTKVSFKKRIGRFSRSPPDRCRTKYFLSHIPLQRLKRYNMNKRIVWQLISNVSTSVS